MKTGLFFGSFNPVHHGHLIIAQHMLNFSDIEEIWFVVSPHNPLKNILDLEDEKHRLEMVMLAIAGNPNIQSSDIEFHLPKPSYTNHTLNQLSNDYPDREFILILGSDNIENFNKWKDHEEILKNYKIYIYLRKDFGGSELTAHSSVQLFDASLLDISSTYIRELIQQEKSISYLVPEKVEKYIEQQKLYRH